MERERKLKRAKEREKTRGDWGRRLLFFARASLSERLEQAMPEYDVLETTGLL